MDSSGVTGRHLVSIRHNCRAAVKLVWVIIIVIPRLCHPFSPMSPPHLSHCFLFLTLCVSPSLPSTRPWDPLNDLIQFEKDGCIQTKVRHRTPMVRSGSLISLSNQGPRRDNCKCQVGRPDRKPPFIYFKKNERKQPATPHAAPGASFSLSLLLFVLSSLCCHCRCRHCLSFCTCLFSYHPTPAVPFVWEGRSCQSAC